MSFLGIPVEISAALLGSGIVAASVTVLGDRWIKSHDDRVEMSVRKMDTCMSNLPLYRSSDSERKQSFQMRLLLTTLMSIEPLLLYGF